MIRLVVMGVSGSGKSSVGRAIAAALKLPFVEGDTLHPPANVEKMASGVPLTDEDRWPWLDKIGAELAKAQKGVVVSCSALKQSYRDRLRQEAGGPLGVHLPRWKFRGLARSYEQTNGALHAPVHA
ncbi:carbohydrate kinase (thermoresistant glucokinase family) [Phyllobacterium sp. 1468]|nr:carbohydrate kinase (thermoresistant glucokinase family) [Phyllobacterium sp. 1468]